ncbi:trypsin-like serine protease [Linderina pennispora]|uniref:Trypsin-like serine protease n=1 Tax=Linderina pennispora TaxID=61395 RepID=A0A1Y1WDD3_9FUNG|nr:trypsin-like serine protease [Linderina pennispora]ORX71547.1 trypsin-like serine protease [Linderina pennispora]
MKLSTLFGTCLVATAFGLPQRSDLDTPQLSKRIIGGNIAATGKYKFASVIKLDIGGRTYTCAGTIISENHIVTAGHCLVGATGTVNSPQNITAGYGSNVSEQQTFQTATNVFLHPQYDPSRFENDIGVIEVPDMQLDGLLEPTQAVTSIGWGMTNYTDYYSVSPELKEAVIKIGNLGSMQVPARSINSNGPHICIENALVPDNGPCSGDSGSPLIAYDGNRPYFAGVMSNGGGAHGEATCAVTGGFAFYTHVKSYISFIANVTGLSL